MPQKNLLASSIPCFTVSSRLRCRDSLFLINGVVLFILARPTVTVTLLVLLVLMVKVWFTRPSVLERRRIIRRVRKILILMVLTSGSLISEPYLRRFSFRPRLTVSSGRRRDWAALIVPVLLPRRRHLMRRTPVRTLKLLLLCFELIGSGAFPIQNWVTIVRLQNFIVPGLRTIAFGGKFLTRLPVALTLRSARLLENPLVPVTFVVAGFARRREVKNVLTLGAVVLVGSARSWLPVLLLGQPVTCEDVVGFGCRSWPGAVSNQ